MEKDLKSLLLMSLHDILSAEEQITDSLAKLVKASESHELKKAFEAHFKRNKSTN